MTNSDESMPLRERATSSIGWIVLDRWSSRILTLIVFAALSRLLAPAQFGLLALASVCTVFLGVFVDSGFSQSLIQRRELQPKDAPTAFWTAVVISVAVYAIAFFGAPLVSALAHEPELTNILRVLCLALPINALALTPAALLERSLQFKQLSIRQFAGSLAGSIAAVIVAVSGGGVWALVTQVLVTAAVSVVTLWASTPWRPTFEYSVDSVRDLASTGIGILSIDLLDAVQGNLDKFLIGAFFTAEQLGYYFLAQRVGAILVELVTSIIGRISLATLSRVQDDIPRLNRILGKLTFAAMAVGIPVFALAAALALQIVPFAFGPHWAQSIPLLWILAPSLAFTSIMYFDRSVFVATGHPGTALVQSVLQNVIGVILLFAMVPFGIVGVAFSRWSRIATWPVRLFYLRKRAHIDLKRYVSQPLRPLSAIAPAVIGIALLQSTPWATSSAAFWTFALPSAVVGILTYAALLWLFAGPVNREVLREIWREVSLKTRSMILTMRPGLRGAKG